jgi:hypothetical protein
MPQFAPGQSGNPKGRPKGSYGGRIKALAALDHIMAKKRNRAALEQALQREFLADPMRFFKTIVMPLLPKDSKIEFDKASTVRWQSLLGGFGGDSADANAEPDGD